MPIALSDVKPWPRQHRVSRPTSYSYVTLSPKPAEEDCSRRTTTLSPQCSSLLLNAVVWSPTLKNVSDVSSLSRAAGISSVLSLPNLRYFHEREYNSCRCHLPSCIGCCVPPCFLHCELLFLLIQQLRCVANIFLSPLCVSLARRQSVHSWYTA